VIPALRFGITNIVVSVVVFELRGREQFEVVEIGRIPAIRNATNIDEIFVTIATPFRVIYLIRRIKYKTVQNAASFVVDTQIAAWSRTDSGRLELFGKRRRGAMPAFKPATVSVISDYSVTR